MAKAHKAPSSAYRRALWITDHARSRFRSRIESPEGESSNGTGHRSDDDLNNWIDSLVQSAIHDGLSEDILDEGAPAQLVDIRHLSNRDDLWAIVKNNTNSRTKKEHSRAVVTLLYTWMVTDSKKSGKWNVASYDGDVSIGGLSSVAKEVLQDIAPTSTNGDKEMSDDKQEEKCSILISYLNKTGDRLYEEWTDKPSAEKSLNNLRRNQKVVTNSIRVFRELVTEARIVL